MTCAVSDQSKTILFYYTPRGEPPHFLGGSVAIRIYAPALDPVSPTPPHQPSPARPLRNRPTTQAQDAVPTRTHAHTLAATPSPTPSAHRLHPAI